MYLYSGYIFPCVDRNRIRQSEEHNYSPRGNTEEKRDRYREEREDSYRDVQEEERREETMGPHPPIDKEGDRDGEEEQRKKEGVLYRNKKRGRGNIGSNALDQYFGTYSDEKDDDFPKKEKKKKKEKNKKEKKRRKEKKEKKNKNGSAT